MTLIRLAAVWMASLLLWGVLSLWIEGRWAWAILETGVFATAGWRVLAGELPALHLASIPLAAAVLWPLLQLALGTTTYRAATWSAALDWLAFFLVFVLSSDLFAERARKHAFLAAASLFGMMTAMVATIGAYACPGKVACVVDTGFAGGVMGPFVNRNQYCAWVELLLPGALYLAAVDTRWRAFFASAAAVMAGSVVASASRAGSVLMGAEIMAVAVALASRRMTRRRMAAGAAQFAVLAALAISLAGWQQLGNRWRTAGPDDLRQDALRASLRMVRARAWMGTGLGTWSRIYPRYATIDRGVFMNQAHNDWAQWAAEGGLPFVLLLLFFAALLWKAAFRSIYGIGLFVFLTHALVDYPMQQRPALAAWLFCIAGVSCACVRGGAQSHDGLL